MPSTTALDPEEPILKPFSNDMLLHFDYLHFFFCQGSTALCLKEAQEDTLVHTYTHGISCTVPLN